MPLLQGQLAVVTGGARGIGAAVAARMVEEGARVAIIDRDADAASAFVREAGSDVVSLPADVRDADAVGTAFAAAVEALGGLTSVVANAGVGSIKELATYTPKEWNRLVEVNLTGTFNTIAAAVPALRPRGGSIVTISSASGLRPTRGEAPYAAAKAGVIALTMSTALEYGPVGIRANCVSPGFIRTPLTEVAAADPAWVRHIEEQTPLGRVGTAAEVADAVVFLASDLARYITGQNLVVDGGSLLPSAQMDPILNALLGG
jgi:NAD(P)-dependent dehydrogenase (short-subunit alcohol dehydrogenase family)